MTSLVKGSIPIASRIGPATTSCLRLAEERRGSAVHGHPPRRAPSPGRSHLYATPDNFGNPTLPGTFGAYYLPAVKIPAGTLEPGVYTVQIPPDSMEEAHRLSDSNGFPSDNSIAYFVVTPTQPGSRSKILWVHDSLTGTAYGCFGGQSIYETPAGGSHIVSYWRPGLDRTASFTHSLIPQMESRGGYLFEYIDLVELSLSPGHLDAYDLVCFVGQFEYMPNEVVDEVARYLDGRGNLFVASHEWGIFRVRLDDAMHRMTAYKWDYLAQDPFWLSGDPANAARGRHRHGFARQPV